MKYLAITLLGFGLVALFAFYLGAIKGEIKWDADKPLTGQQARTVGIISLIVGLIMIAAGGFLAMRVLGA
ncbi:MAG TPA: hypothetical protein VGN72_08710 [Tepidisphaeraceae bacterium]|jgi:hypothetical protein|nr:hypothetical protein [Tepidisphaeraceae bacterium]